MEERIIQQPLNTAPAWRKRLNKWCRSVMDNRWLYLLILPALYCAILLLLGANELILTLALVAYATLLGLNTVVFPAAYGADTSTGAGMALISHVLSVVTFPLMYALLTLFIH